MIKINDRTIIYFLYFYIIGIFIWDYTSIYQLALIIMVLLSFLIYLHHPKSLAHVYLICYSLLFIYFLLHTFAGLSVDPTLSINYLITMGLNLLAACAIILILNSKNKIISTMKVMIYVSLIACLYVTIIDRHNIFSGELGGLVSKPFFVGIYSHNDIAFLASLSVLFLAYFRVDNIRFKYNLLLSGYFSIFVLLTGARKSFLLVLIGLFVYPILFGNNSKKIDRKLIEIILICILIFATFYIILHNDFLYSVIGNRFEGFFNGVIDGDYSESSAVSRSVMKDTAISLIKIHPFKGYGLNTFRTFPGSYGTWSHNNYLELAVSGGLIPTLIYYSFHIFAIRKLARRNNKLDRMMLTLMLYLFIFDYLSVSYISRISMLLLCMVNAHIALDINGTQNQI